MSNSWNNGVTKATQITFANWFDAGPFAVLSAPQFAEFRDALGRVGNAGRRRRLESRLTNELHHRRILEFPACHLGVGHFARMTAIARWDGGNGITW